jgi:hypothetical protein
LIEPQVSPAGKLAAVGPLPLFEAAQPPKPAAAITQINPMRNSLIRLTPFMDTTPSK